MLTPGTVVRVLRGDAAGSLGTVVEAWSGTGEVLLELHCAGDRLALCPIADVSTDVSTDAVMAPPAVAAESRTTAPRRCACAVSDRHAARPGPTTFCFDPAVAEVAEGLLWGATVVGYALFRALTGGDHPFDPPGPTRRMVNAVRRSSWSCLAAPRRRRRCASRRVRCRTEPGSRRQGPGGGAA